MSKDSTLSNKGATARRDRSSKEPGTGGAKMAPQKSKKSGKHSAVEKAGASRPESGPAPGAKRKPGSFGIDRSGTAGPKGLGGRRGEVSGKEKKTNLSTKRIPE